MTLERLAATIAARKGADPETSWTAKLLSKGPEKCAEKFGEEAVEAAGLGGRGRRHRRPCHQLEGQMVGHRLHPVTRLPRPRSPQP